MLASVLNALKTAAWTWNTNIMQIALSYSANTYKHASVSQCADSILMWWLLYTGRDGTRAFITGDFTDSGLTDDVIGLTVQELHSLQEWAQFYHKEYKYKGEAVYTTILYKCIHYFTYMLKVHSF